ncbi:sialidase family protein [Fodinibius sp. AD559]|uniref:sialidase family protein n=1 Tax=Fodinibius sp. AD559 TaxID=3424179 RepID=UPI004046EA2E
MKNSNLILVFVLAVVFMGCNSSPKSATQFSNPASQNSVYPYLYSTNNQLYMSWITNNSDETHSLNYASYSNDEWSAPKTIATDSTWFVNWADFPSIIANNDGPVAAHWLNKKPGGPYAYDVNISATDKSGHWNQALVPHNDDTPTEHGFVSMVPWGEDTFLVVWLDGRKTDGRSGEEYYNLDYAMTLRGALIDRDGNIQERFLIDDAVCDCCPTSLIKTSEGAIVAYRNRTDNEIRDIYTSRFNGEEWTSPKAVYNDGWEIGACPVNGPMLAAEDSLVTIAWHTGANDNPTAKYAYSVDSGTTFSEPVILNDSTSLGRVDAEIYKGISYLSWLEKGKNKALLKVASFNGGNQINQSKTVAKLSESRRTGYPQMEQMGNALFFAWTQSDSTGTKVITQKMSLTP